MNAPLKQDDIARIGRLRVSSEAGGGRRQAKPYEPAAGETARVRGSTAALIVAGVFAFVAAGVADHFADPPASRMIAYSAVLEVRPLEVAAAPSSDDAPAWQTGDHALVVWGVDARLEQARDGFTLELELSPLWEVVSGDTTYQGPMPARGITFVTEVRAVAPGSAEIGFSLAENGRTYALPGSSVGVTIEP